MIRPRAIALLAAAGLSGVAALWMAGGALGSVPGGEAEPATARILVASRDLQPGDRLGPGMVEWQAWPRAALHTDHQRDGATSSTALAGRIVRDMVRAGEPLLAGHLAPAGSAGPAAALLAPGRRAIAVAVSAASGVGGLLQPGDRVDIILTAMPGQSEGFARTVAADVRVLGLDRQLGPGGTGLAAADSGPPGTVTLDVGPGEAEAIALAQEMGRLSLALRTGRGGQQPALQTVRQRDLAGGLLPAHGDGPLQLAAAAYAAPLPPQPLPHFAAQFPALPTLPPAAAPSSPPAGSQRVERVRGVEIVRGSVEPAPAAPPAEPGAGPA